MQIAPATLIVPAILIVTAFTAPAPALAQTPASMPPSLTASAHAPPHGPTPPKPPTPPPAAPKSKASDLAGLDVESAAQVMMFRSAQEAQQDLKSLMESLGAANGQRSAPRRASSNPCEREGKGSTVTCLDDLKRKTSQMKLGADDRYRLGQQLAIVRDTVLTAQRPGTPNQRATRYAEAKKQAEDLDVLLAELAKPKPPANAKPSFSLPGLSLPGLGN